MGHAWQMPAVYKRERIAMQMTDVCTISIQPDISGMTAVLSKRKPDQMLTDGS